jgi:uncharacterized protein (DUF2147 family)
MIRSLCACAALLFSANLSFAQEPTGEWLVKDKVATVKIDNCDGRIWGIIAWEKETGGVDQKNPDPAKRRRPTLGMPIILGMKATLPNRWEGEIYNAKDGKTYSAKIALSGPDTLRVEGCILGFLCGGEEWTRVSADARPAKTGRRITSKPGEAEVCSLLTALPGRSHQGRLE